MRHGKRTINMKLGAGLKMFVYPVQRGEIVTFPGTKRSPRFIPNWHPMGAVDVSRKDAANELLRKRQLA